ncbi:MAG: hypothetical protein JW818_03355 [Pirellulales bacterium]|nr:hypothetical protein [Pirellulales bacterium]
MNYFAHALPFLDRPLVAVATGVPDMLAVVDRRVRIRSRHVQPHLHDPNPTTADVARGLLQHLQDDVVFHRGSVFAELAAGLTLRVRDVLDDADGLRPRFLGHLLVEILLDAALVQQHPDRLEEYYRVLETVDAAAVQQAVNQMAPRATDRLAPMIAGVCRERFLWDYLDDARLFGRLNQIMRRVGLEPLPEAFAGLLPFARGLVTPRHAELLVGIPVRLPDTD